MVISMRSNGIYMTLKVKEVYSTTCYTKDKHFLSSIVIAINSHTSLKDQHSLIGKTCLHKLSQNYKNVPTPSEMNE